MNGEEIVVVIPNCMIEKVLTGLVLCGGKSTRMESDKGLLSNGEKTWAEIAVEKIKTFANHYFISINEGQLSTYAHHFSRELLIMDNNPIPGPARGLVSAHVQQQHSDFLTIACDMLLVEEELLSLLLDQYKLNTGYDAYIFRHLSGEFEPLLGIYTSTGLAKIKEQFEAGKLEKYSMKYLLERLKVAAIPIPNNLINQFTNYNYPNQWH